MKWEIINNRPRLGDVRFVTKFAWLPTIVLNKLTMTDHRIWLELYVEEQMYKTSSDGWYEDWYTVNRTIHV
jgi:hypothetical protein